jgi:NAD+ synthase
MNLADSISQWIRQQVNVAGARGLLLGLSGGIDSAVVARLCQMATPDNVVGVILPCHSDPQDERDARLVAEHFQLPITRVDLDQPYEHLIEAARAAQAQLPPGLLDASPAPDDLRARLPLANIKPRLRMICLYFLANQLNYLVAGTGNRSELAIGYFTKYGDGATDLLPLGDLFKSEVRTLARELGVPREVIDKPPSAGLWLGQTDEDEMGFSYAELEAYLEHGPGDIRPSVAMKIERLSRASEHKRKLPPIFERP